MPHLQVHSLNTCNGQRVLKLRSGNPVPVSKWAAVTHILKPSLLSPGIHISRRLELGVRTR